MPIPTTYEFESTRYVLWLIDRFKYLESKQVELEENAQIASGIGFCESHVEEDAFIAFKGVGEDLGLLRVVRESLG